MNNLLRELIEGSGDPEEPQHEVPEIRDIFKPPPGYDVEGRRISVGSGGFTTSGGGYTYTDNQILTPWDIAMMTPQEILTSNLRREQAKGFDRFWDPNDPSDKKRAKEAMIDVAKGLPRRLFEKLFVNDVVDVSQNRGDVFPPGTSFSGSVKQLVDIFGNWLQENAPGGGSTTSGGGSGGSDGGDGGGGAKLSPEEIKAFVGAITSGDISAPFNNPVRGAGWAEGEGMFSQSSSSDGGGGAVPTKKPTKIQATYRTDPMRGGSPPPTTKATDRRAIDPPSIYRERGMLIPAPGRDLNSRMDSGLDYLNPKEESVSSTDMEAKKEPELFGTALKALGKIFGGQPGEKGGGPTPWDVAAMGVGGPELWVVKQVLGQLFKNGTPSQKDGMFQDVEFKPWALDKFEDRMNEAPLVERWAAQMKEQIGWQSMTPDERKDYIKNNKHDKNNHIIMHYNMYRRR